MADIALSDSESRAEIVFPQLALIAVAGSAGAAFLVAVSYFFWPLPWWALLAALGLGGLGGVAYGGAHIIRRIEYERDEHLRQRDDELDIKRRALWIEERKLNVDLDGDGHVGAPPKAAYRAASGSVLYEDRPGEDERAAFAEFIDVAWTHGITSRRDWHARGLDESLWERFTERLILAGVARRADSRPHSQLIKLANADRVRAIFAEFI